MALALDKNGYTNNSSGTSLASSSITPTASVASLILAGFSMGSSNVSAQSCNNSFVEQTTGDTNRTVVDALIVASTSGSYSTTESWTATSNNGAAAGICNFTGVNGSGSVLQHLSNFGTASATVTPSAPTSGNLLAIWISQNNVLSGLSAPGGWTAVGAGIDQSQANAACGQWYWKVADGTETSITATGTVGAKVRISFIEFPVAAAASAVVFRKTLSPIGSRAGSRQTHGWGA